MRKMILASPGLVVLVALSACTDDKSSDPDAGGAGGRAGTSGDEGGAAGNAASGAGAGGVTLDCTGEWPEEWQAKEAEALAAVNAIRAEGADCGGVMYDPAPPVSVDSLLTEICRCFALEQARAGDDGLVESEADAALAERVDESTFTGTLHGYDGSMFGPSMADILEEMLADPTGCSIIHDPTVTLLGVGYVGDPGGDEPHRWAGIMASPRSDTPPDPTLPDWAFEPGPGRQVELAGVSLAGADFGDAVPGTFDIDYTYPNSDEVTYFVSKGMNVFRIPFRWERMQRELDGPLDPTELSRLVEVVTAVTDSGALAVLDPHNYARYQDELVGSSSVPNSAFADFWGRLALEFGANDNVAFALMNEPHELGDVGGTEAWLESANAAIAAIRDAGAENLLLVPGDHWTGAASWTSDIDGTSNAAVMPGVVDPADNFVFEVHQYLDVDSSGTDTECVSQSIGVQRVTGFTNWLRANGYRGFLGEFGAAATQTCYRAVDNLLAHLGGNSDVWLGWTWWAAGPWWGDYPMSIEPIDGTDDAPMMTILERYLTAP